MEGAVRLTITHHALDRFGTYHADFMRLIPSSVGKELPPNEAYRVLKVATAILKGLDTGKPMKMPAPVQAYKRSKYGTLDFYVYDKKRGDVFTLVREPGQVVVVTATRLRAIKTQWMTEDPNPPALMQDIQAVRLPYYMAPGPLDPRLTRIFRSSGSEVKAVFHGLSFPPEAEKEITGAEEAAPLDEGMRKD